MNFVLLALLIFFSLTVEQPVVGDPVEEIAAIKLGRRADGEVFIMEWYKDKYFSDTCEVYETFMPYVFSKCFEKDVKMIKKKSDKNKPTVKL